MNSQRVTTELRISDGPRIAPDEPKQNSDFDHAGNTRARRPDPSPRRTLGGLLRSRQSSEQPLKICGASALYWDHQELRHAVAV